MNIKTFAKRKIFDIYEGQNVLHLNEVFGVVHYPVIECTKVIWLTLFRGPSAHGIPRLLTLFILYTWSST